MENAQGRQSGSSAHAGSRPRRGRRRLLVSAVGIIAAVALAACGSGTSTTKGTSAPTTPPTTGGANPHVVKSLGVGVTADSIKLGVALVNFDPIKQFTDTIRTAAEQKQIYGIYIDDINAHGGINGRKIDPVYRYYAPLGTAQIVPLCTTFAQDDKVFAVVGTFIDFSGDAQTCITKQQQRILMTFNLTQAMIDKSPPGLEITAGLIPERSASILLELAQKQGTLKGKKVAILGDTTESTVVNGSIKPALDKLGVERGTDAILDVGTTGDTTAAQSQLQSFMEKWKTQGVNTLFVSGDLASTKQFIQKIKQQFPDMLLLGDNTDVKDQAQQEQEAHITPNPYEGYITAGGLSPKEYDASANWKYCADIYQKATGRVPENAEQVIKDKAGKIDDTYGTINDACQTLTMFRDIGEKVGPYLNNANWQYTVDNFGSIENRGSGPYSSLHAGKYSADDNWRLQVWDSTIKPSGNWKGITKLENITG